MRRLWRIIYTLRVRVSPLEFNSLLELPYRMTVAEALEKISKALAVLAYQTRAENLTGMFSKNRLAEDLLLPLFRIIFAAPQLRNLNEAGSNFPSIDLADAKNRLAIQVTSENAASKITGTLNGFIANGNAPSYDRLVIFVLRDAKPRYSNKTLRSWAALTARAFKFNPASDIVATLDLFKLIERLPAKDIFSVEEIVTHSIIGEEYIHVESILARQALRQLNYEKHAAKYIPDIFVETRELKNLARHFAHPVLFFERTLEFLEVDCRLGSNRLLEKAGLPPLPFPDARKYRGQRTLHDVETAAASLRTEFDPLFDLLSKYESFRKEQPPFPIRKGCEAYYEQNTYSLHNLGWSVRYRLRDELDELSAARSRIFILSGKAGQGKTNFVCDFLENFLWKHRVPCSYINARRLSAVQSNDLADAIQRIIFDGATTSFAQAAELLAAHAQRRRRPYVLIIDGLNEHRRLNEFAEQLEQFLELALEYPDLRFLLTCRSEFFQQRFGNLVKGFLEKHTFLFEANEHRQDNEFFEEVVRGYFKFFRVGSERVSHNALESLRRDILLLRFFCEAYGARGKPADYRQPFLQNIYREQIFEIYLKRKLGTADTFLRLTSGQIDPTAPNAELRTVLELVVGHMVASRRFSDVPASTVPAHLSTALYALLDEELILRRDLSSPAGIFSTSAETLNFTFDELRDYLIAQYLIHRTFATSRAAFQAFVDSYEGSYPQFLEGLKRFLFYASRRQENVRFWDYYHEQPWYMHAYDTEIFNVDPTLLREEDRDVVSCALSSGGERAQQFSRALAVHWHPQGHPILGLKLLLDFVTTADDDHFDNLIVATFRAIKNFNEGASAEAFCEFINKEILPECTFVADAPEHNLFRFLVLLLPVNSDVRLDNGADTLFRTIIERALDYAIDLLVEALQYKPTRQRPHVWRLLTSMIGRSPRLASLVTLANQDRIPGETPDRVLEREAGRFVERWFLAYPLPK